MRIGRPDRDLVATLVLIALFFLGEGILIPFYPLWLHDRGLDASEVSVVLGVPLLLRIFAAPVFGRMADRHGQRVMIGGASTIVLAAILVLVGVEGFWPLLLLTVIYLLGWQSMPMQLDAVVIGLVRRGLVGSYGPVRALGSVFFIVSATIAGALIVAPIPDGLLLAFAVIVLGIIVTTLFLPRHEIAVTGPGAAPLTSVWRQPPLVLVMLASALVQSPHVAFVAIGGIHMRALGFSDALIGIVVSTGTVAEIAMFLVGPRLFGRLAPVTMIAIGAAAAIVRWAILPQVTTPAGMLALQLSHALTFSLTALGMIGHLVRTVDPRQVASTQGLFVALNSALMALLTLLAGTVYTAVGGPTFLLLSLFPAAALLVLAARAMLGARQSAPAAPATASD